MRISPAGAVISCGPCRITWINGEEKYWNDMSNRGKIDASSELLLPNPLWDKFVNDMSNKEQIDKAFDILRDCFERGGKLLLCGNGGSAADCDHIAAELVNGMTKRTLGLPAFSLCSQVGVITSIANDRGVDEIFAQQVRAYGKPGDVLLAISTSGKSRNVIAAIIATQERHMKAILLHGQPGETTQAAQERHQQIYHELCRRLEKEFYP